MCLQHNLCLTSVYWASLYTRCRVPGDFIHLVVRRPIYAHLYIGRKCTDCSIKSYTKCIKSYTKCITEHIDSFCFIHLGLPSLVTTRQIPFLRLEGEQHIDQRFADWLYHMTGPHKVRIQVTNTSCWNQRCVIRD